jgi:hypothetical protein
VIFLKKIYKIKIENAEKIALIQDLSTVQIELKFSQNQRIVFLVFVVQKVFLHLAAVCKDVLHGSEHHLVFFVHFQRLLVKIKRQ